MKVFVEGGGSEERQRRVCRQGLRKFLEKSGFKGRMPKIIAGGPRQEAYDSYCNELSGDEPVLLLVDSEGPVKAHHQADRAEDWQPWQHLGERPDDRWAKPSGASDTDCHLMVESMENWLLADREALQGYFGQGFQQSKLPSKDKPLEEIPKSEALNKLKDATRDCATKSRYDKGQDSFRLLGRIDPQQVSSQSPWAKRFLDSLEKKISAK